MNKNTMNVMNIVKALSDLPHRGATTINEKKAADILVELLTKVKARIERQSFKTPVTYIWQVCWMLGTFTCGLILTISLIFPDYMSMTLLFRVPIQQKVVVRNSTALFVAF